VTQVMTRVDVPAEIRMVPYTYLRLFGHPPAVVASVPGGLCLLAAADAALAVAAPWGAAVAGSPRDDGVLELRSRNRPADAVTMQPGQWADQAAVPGDLPAWAGPAIRAAARLRAADHGAGGATMVVHTGLPASFAIPSAAAVAAATSLAFAEMHGLPAGTAVPVGPLAPGPAALVDRATVLAALNGQGNDAVVVRADSTVDWVPFDLVGAGLRLLIVEPGDTIEPATSRDTAAGALDVPSEGPGTVGGTVPAGLAEQALHRGDPAQLGPLLTAASAGESRPALVAATAAAIAAGALGAGTVGDPSGPAVGVLLRYADLVRVRFAVRAALPVTRFRPRFLTTTLTGATGRVVVSQDD
jgi:hypothetical protein